VLVFVESGAFVVFLLWDLAWSAGRAVIVREVRNLFAYSGV